VKTKDTRFTNAQLEHNSEMEEDKEDKTRFEKVPALAKASEMSAQSRKKIYRKKLIEGTEISESNAENYD